jgi:hypothetical protein
MSIVKTDLRVTRERAKQLRYYPTPGIAATNVQDAIVAAAAIASPSPTTVTFAMSPYTALPADRVLLVDTSGGAVAINIGGGAARNGFDIEVRDITGNAVANNISVSYTGTVDGLASPITISAPFGGYVFNPLASGNWYLENI